MGKLVEGTRSEGAKVGGFWRINFSRVEWTVVQVANIKGLPGMVLFSLSGWECILERSSPPSRRQLGVESSGGDSDASP